MLSIAELLDAQNEGSLVAAQKAIREAVAGSLRSAPASNKERQMVFVPEFAAWAAQQGLKMSPEMHAVYVLAIVEQVFEAELQQQQNQQARPTPEFDLLKLFKELDEEAEQILMKLQQQQLPESTVLVSLMRLLCDQFRDAFNAVLRYLAWMLDNHPQQLMQSPAFQAYQRMMTMAPALFPNGLDDYVDQENMPTMDAVLAIPNAQLVAQSSGVMACVPQIDYVPGAANNPFGPTLSGHRVGFTTNAAAGGAGYSDSREAANAAAQAARQVTPGATYSSGMGLGGTNDGSSGSANADGFVPVPVPGNFEDEEEKRRKLEERLGMRPKTRITGAG